LACSSSFRANDLLHTKENPSNYETLVLSGELRGLDRFNSYQLIRNPHSPQAGSTFQVNGDAPFLAKPDKAAKPIHRAQGRSQSFVGFTLRTSATWLRHRTFFIARRCSSCGDKRWSGLHLE